MILNIPAILSIFAADFSQYALPLLYLIGAHALGDYAHVFKKKQIAEQIAALLDGVVLDSPK